MHTDELRAELAELAREVDEFPQDLGAIRHRVARRRAVLGSIAVVVSIAVIVAVVTTSHSGSSRVNIAGTEKEVVAANLPRLDAVVVLPAGATEADAARVQALLDNAGSVEKYATLPASTLARVLELDPNTATKALRARVCTDPATRSYAVELLRSAQDPVHQLTIAIGPAGAVEPVGKQNVDVEVFMKVNATDAEVAAMRAPIDGDADVTRYTFLDHEAAYREFKRLFADQPALIAKTKASSVPESFRLEVREGVSPPTVARRFEGLPGVEQVITAPTPDEWSSFAKIPLTQACSAHP